MKKKKKKIIITTIRTKWQEEMKQEKGITFAMFIKKKWSIRNEMPIVSQQLWNINLNATIFEFDRVCYWFGWRRER